MRKKKITVLFQWEIASILLKYSLKYLTKIYNQIKFENLSNKPINQERPVVVNVGKMVP